MQSLFVFQRQFLMRLVTCLSPFWLCSWLHFPSNSTMVGSSGRWLPGWEIQMGFPARAWPDPDSYRLQVVRKITLSLWFPFCLSNKKESMIMVWSYLIAILSDIVPYLLLFGIIYYFSPWLPTGDTPQTATVELRKLGEGVGMLRLAHRCLCWRAWANSAAIVNPS